MFNARAMPYDHHSLHGSRKDLTHAAELLGYHVIFMGKVDAATTCAYKLDKKVHCMVVLYLICKSSMAMCRFVRSSRLVLTLPQDKYKEHRCNNVNPHCLQLVSSLQAMTWYLSKQ